MDLLHLHTRRSCRIAATCCVSSVFFPPRSPSRATGSRRRPFLLHWPPRFTCLSRDHIQSGAMPSSHRACASESARESRERGRHNKDRGGAVHGPGRASLALPTPRPLTHPHHLLSCNRTHTRTHTRACGPVHASYMCVCCFHFVSLAGLAFSSAAVPPPSPSPYVCVRVCVCRFSLLLSFPYDFVAYRELCFRCCSLLRTDARTHTHADLSTSLFLSLLFHSLAPRCVFCRLPQTCVRAYVNGWPHHSPFTACVHCHRRGGRAHARTKLHPPFSRVYVLWRVCAS